MENLWVAGSCSVIGASHRRRRLAINQDAARVSTDQRRIAVADGHGSDEHLLSDLGARYAVDLAMTGDPTTLPRRWREGLLASIGELDRAIEERVPLVDETQAASISAGVRQDPHRAAGSTLLFAGAGLERADQVLFYQIGDGRILVLDQDGVASLPLAPDHCAGLGPLTSSLCLDDADRYARLQAWTGPAPIAAILLMTDGFSDGYTDAQLGDISRGLLAFAREQGLARLLVELPGDLDRISEQGLGDDTTIALMIRRDLLPAGDTP